MSDAMTDPVSRAWINYMIHITNEYWKCKNEIYSEFKALKLAEFGIILHSEFNEAISFNCEEDMLAFLLKWG